ncbi:MAG TPA: Cache 3/Cache 2 fusion domain-containing protein, partial [Spirochaetia bacterium]|nr:Cache 3/Cache 2 fusion domain-containing protein [Spirochaetia bacterium]
RRFVGRAFVVNAWYITAYEPIRDAAGDVVGMLYTGVAEQSAASLRRQILETTVGDTGYVYVLDSSGAYIISQNGERDGEVILDAVDAEGRLFVRDIIAKATDLRAGEFATERYPWQNPGDPAPRMKTVSIAYFAPWDWVIAAGTYDEEFMAGLRLIEEVDARGRRAMFAVLAVSIVFVVLLWLQLGSRLSRPIVQAVGFAERISLGELDVSLDVNQKDEIGVLADALRGMLASLQYKADLVKRIADGDLTVEVNVASEKDGLGRSLVTMVDSLNDIIGRVQVAVEQVTAGAGEVANASQQLSQGATESASSVEEISASINEMNGQTTQSAQGASEASELSRKAADDARAGQARMGELRSSMESISEASGTIRKVVKLIDDIAFQIKVLALNANVEAARAGKYGKGFAVVAEEVGNLAARSAAAVKETTAMVDQSEASIAAGGSLTVKTAEQLDAIVTGTIRVAEVLEEIAAASKEQAQGIEQIADGLGQVDDVTQSNTASAEQSAAASEELAAQAQELRRAIATFRLREEGGSSPQSLTDSRTPAALLSSR